MPSSTHCSGEAWRFHQPLALIAFVFSGSDNLAKEAVHQPWIAAPWIFQKSCPMLASV